MGLLDFLCMLFSSANDQDPLTKDSDGDTIPDSWDLNPYYPNNNPDDDK